jgi:argininosuccinate lyase
LADKTVLQSGEQPDALFDFTNGIAVDRRLAAQEVRVQKAWMHGLVDLGIVTAGEAVRVEEILDRAEAEIEAGTFAWTVRDEDIHMHLERYVTDRLGDVGKRMHLGRSRNDLIATTLRLYVHDRMLGLAYSASLLVKALAAKARETKGLIVPGLTHLQHGQPVSMGHVLLGHAWDFHDDLHRMTGAAGYAVETMPLGAAALAGSPLPLDYHAMAKSLGFAAPCRNSYSAVGNRDFMLAAIDALALLAVHLGRLAEDCIYWSATPVGLLKLAPGWSTGSSIMPNKRNPDVPELTRGKAAHIIGTQTDAHVLVRTVPTSYGSDLHELKQVFLRAADEAEACLTIWPHFVAESNFSEEVASRLLNQGHILATEIADALTAAGVPFREAYKAVKILVELAEDEGLQIHELAGGEVNRALDSLGLKPLAKWEFTFEAAVERRMGPGGTAMARVEEALAELERLS